MVLTDIHTGLRKGELLGLRWEQIDFGRGVISLGRHTKSGKGREVPFNREVYAVLAPLRSDAGGLEATGRVWGNLRKIDTAYHAALLRAKIVDADVNFHTLRYTFASHYVMRGGNIVKLQATSGTPACARRRSTRGWLRITWWALQRSWRGWEALIQRTVNAWSARRAGNSSDPWVSM